MKTIYKYEIGNVDGDYVPMPIGAKVLTVKEQRGQTCIWAEVDPDETRTELRMFQITGTGWELPTNDRCEREYIGTVFSDGFVWHIYEMIDL